MKIISGVRPGAPVVMISGLPGSGKSTLAATLTKPVFLDIEGGLKYIDAPKTERPIETSDELFVLLRDLGVAAKTGKREFNYIVIDSVDWAVRLFVSKITGSGQGLKLEDQLESVKNTLNRGDGSYGNGKMHLENVVRDMFIKYLKKLNTLGYGIILISHADRKSVMDYDGASVDRITPKMAIVAMDALIEYCDNLFYIYRGDDDKRHIVVNPTDAIMAKNRIGIQEDEFIVDDNFDFESLITTGKATRAGQPNKG